MSTQIIQKYSNSLKMIQNKEFKNRSIGLKIIHYQKFPAVFYLLYQVFVSIFLTLPS